MTVLIVDGDAIIMQELRVFKDRMYDGAEVVELISGIECLNFLLEQVEEISEDTVMFVEAAVFEADMRIKLMVEKEHTHQKEMHDKISRCVRVFGRQLEEIQRKFRSPLLAEEVMEIVQKRIQERMEQKS
jgi:hypothetical protein